MHYKDKILSTLDNFSSNEFIEDSVKHKFTRKFYDHHGLWDHRIKKEEYKDEFVLTINNTNLETGITKQHHYHYTLEEYLPEFIEECFVNFYDEFYKFAVTVEQISGRRIYYNFLLGQLEGIAKKIKNSDELSKKRRGIINNCFLKGIKTFIWHFGKKKAKTSSGRLDLPDSFKLKGFGRRSYILIELRKNMIDNSLIDENTNLSKFIRIFSGKKVYNKVVWKGNKSQLHYFVKYLNSIHPSFIDKKDYKWEIAMKCFDFIDTKTKKQFDWRKLKGTHSPILRKRQQIESCFL